MDVPKLLYTKKEAAYALGRTLRTIDYMMANKQIGFQKAGKRVLFPVSEIKRVASQNYYESHRKSA